MNTALEVEDLDALYPPPVDRLDAILDLAGSVLLDHSPDPGATRLERLARWIIANVDATIASQHSGGISMFHAGRVRVMRCGIQIGISRPELGAETLAFSADEAREVATALLRAAEKAEED